MDNKPNFVKNKKKATKKKLTAKKSTKTIDLSRNQKNRQKTPKTATSLVAELIIANKTGSTIEKLVEKTGYSKTKLYGIVYRLKQQGKIKNKAHGVYTKA